jgi:hypothetical protein
MPSSPDTASKWPAVPKGSSGPRRLQTAFGSVWTETYDSPRRGRACVTGAPSRGTLPSTAGAAEAPAFTFRAWSPSTARFDGAVTAPTTRSLGEAVAAPAADGPPLAGSPGSGRPEHAERRRKIAGERAIEPRRAQLSLRTDARRPTLPVRTGLPIFLLLVRACAAGEVSQSACEGLVGSCLGDKFTEASVQNDAAPPAARHEARLTSGPQVPGSRVSPLVTSQCVTRQST